MTEASWSTREEGNTGRAEIGVNPVGNPLLLEFSKVYMMTGTNNEHAI